MVLSGNFLFGVFLASLALISYLTYGTGYMPHVLLSVFCISFAVSLFFKRSFSKPLDFLAEFLKHCYSISFSLSAALLVFLASSASLGISDSFHMMGLIVAMMTFPTVAAFSFSLAYFEGVLSGTKAPIGKILSAATVVAATLSVAAAMAVAWIGISYIVEPNLTSYSDTVDNELCRTAAVEACQRCADENDGDYSSCGPEAYLSAADNVACENRLQHESSGDGDLSCGMYIGQHYLPEVRDLEVYRDVRGLRDHYIDSVKSDRDELFSSAGPVNGMFFDCLTGECYSIPTRAVLSTINLAIDMYSITSAESIVYGELNSMRNGPIGDSPIDVYVVSAAGSLGEAPILYRDYADDLSYVAALRSYIDDNPVVSGVQEAPPPSYSMAIESAMSMGETPSSPMTVNRESIERRYGNLGDRLLLGSLENVMMRSSLGREIFTISEKTSAKYRMLVYSDDPVYRVLLDGVDITESIESKMIRHRMLYQKAVALKIYRESGTAEN